MRTHLFTTFVDLTKAPATVSRDELWKIMRKFGCPEQFMHFVHQFHDGVMVRVTDNGTVPDAFAVTKLMGAYRDERPGIGIAYKTEGHLNIRRLRTSGCLVTTTIHDLLFTEAAPLVTTLLKCWATTFVLKKTT
ncbi:hypothetical protein SprV_0401522400 [Sparganum proliferum]